MGTDPLFQVLAHRGIKAKWLARQVGINAEALSRAKHGTRPIPLRVRRRIAEVLGLPEDMLFAARQSVQTEGISAESEPSPEAPQTHQEPQEGPSESTAV